MRYSSNLIMRENKKFFKKSILVTGIPRSGTTWFGKMLSASDKVEYIHEPFNNALRNPLLAKQFPVHAFYINRDSRQRYYAAIENVLNFHYAFYRILRKARTTSDIKKNIHLYNHYKRCRRERLTPLIKDPDALFSAEWLELMFGMKIVIVVRHPAAIICSRLQLGWKFSFEPFLKQPLLLSDLMEPYKNNMIEMNENKKTDLLTNAILMWEVYNYVIEKYKKVHPDWIFCKHEDFCDDPINSFKELYHKLGLMFDDTVEMHIVENSNKKNPLENRDKLKHCLKRNSAELKTFWKTKLSKKEIDFIKDRVSLKAQTFYREEHW